MVQNMMDMCKCLRGAGFLLCGHITVVVNTPVKMDGKKMGSFINVIRSLMNNGIGT